MSALKCRVQREVLEGVDADGLIRGGGCNEWEAIGIRDRDPGARSGYGFEFREREDLEGMRFDKGHRRLLGFSQLW